MSESRNRKSKRTTHEEEFLERRAQRRQRRYKRWGKTRKLYRDKENALMLGVLAGVATYLGTERWIVRLAFVTLLLGGLGILVLVYIVMWFILDDKPPRTRRAHDEYDAEFEEYDDVDEAYEEAEEEQYNLREEQPRVLLRVVRAEIEEQELRLRRIEKHVTSPIFRFDKELGGGF